LFKRRFSSGSIFPYINDTPFLQFTFFFFSPFPLWLSLKKILFDPSPFLEPPVISFPQALRLTLTITRIPPPTPNFFLPFHKPRRYFSGLFFLRTQLLSTTLSDNFPKIGLSFSSLLDLVPFFLKISPLFFIVFPDVNNLGTERLFIPASFLFFFRLGCGPRQNLFSNTFGRGMNLSFPLIRFSSFPPFFFFFFRGV